MKPVRCALLVVYRFDTGGSERLAGVIAEDLAGRGIRVTVCATHGGEGRMSRELEAKGVRCVALDGERHGRVARRWALWRLFRAERPDVVLVQHFPILALVHRPARLAGVRRVLVTEHTEAHFVGDAALQRKAARLGRRVEAVTVIHGGLRAFFVDHVGVCAGRVHVVPNGVDTARFAPVERDAGSRAELGVGDDGTVLIGCVARLHPDKDHRGLIEACRRLLDSGHRGFHLAVIGDGGGRASLEAVARDAGLDGYVSWLGDRDDVAALMPQLDVFVLPSRTEGLPLVVLEALSCGVPCVATRVGGIPEVLADDAGVVVDPGDPGALADALAALLHSPARRLELGRRGRERVLERYGIETMTAAYRALLLGGEAGREAA